MNFYFRIFWLVSIFSTLYALTPAQIEQGKAMLSANPSLLNSPDVATILQDSPLSPANSNNIKQKTEVKEIEVINNIDTNQSNTEKSQNDLRVENFTYKVERLNPLLYVSNDEALWRIKSQQSTLIKRKLERFSKQFFKNKNSINPNHFAAPTNYVINKGDIITFWIYGGTNKKEELEVDARGNINIPQVGPVHVAGEKFQEVKELLTNYLSSSYKNSQVVVDLNSFSTAQVTVTGYVNAPGIYNTTSVTTVKDVLMEAQGVSDIGSVRKIKVLRKGKIVDTIDYYHLLLQGLEHGDTVLQSGDVIHIPKAYGLITIDGEVNNPAIYEIEPNESLAHILKIAGGLKAAANGKKIYVKRYNKHSHVEYLTLSLSQARQVIAKDGDEVYVGRLAQADERYIELVGNVVQEGKKHIGSKKLKLSTFLRQQLKGNHLDSLFLENTNFEYAMIKRIGKDLSPKIYHVNLRDILEKRTDFTLHNKDILYIFNKLDTQINPYVTIEQALTPKEEKALKYLQENNLSIAINQQPDRVMVTIDQNITDYNLTKSKLQKFEENKKIVDNIKKILLQKGQFQYTNNMTITDLIHMAGIASPFDTKHVKIISKDPITNKATVSIINYKEQPNFKLHPFDKVYIFDLDKTQPVAQASIMGEVVTPGTYPISEGMTLKEFIESCGGLSEKAYPKSAEIIRYHIENGERRKKIFNVDLTKSDTFIVQKYDQINIKKIPYWEKEQKVTIKGHVKFPGTYIIHSGEKLASLIERAGGFTDDAFLYGAIFTRKEVAKLQKENLKKALSKLKEQVILASLRSSASRTMGRIDTTQGMSGIDSLIAEAEKAEPIGRISINISCNMEEFRHSSSNLTLKDGDTLIIPAINDTVVVNGEVMNPMALTYQGESVRNYIKKCGGLTELADVDHIFVLHANGEAEKASIASYLFSKNVEIKRGDVIVIPKKLMFESGIDLVGNIADIIYKLTLTVVAMHTVGAI